MIGFWILWFAWLLQLMLWFIQTRRASYYFNAWMDTTRRLPPREAIEQLDRFPIPGLFEPLYRRHLGLPRAAEGGQGQWGERSEYNDEEPPEERTIRYF